MDGGTIWSLGIVSMVHVARIMRVIRIISSRMVHVMVFINSDTFSVLVFLFVEGRCCMVLSQRRMCPNL